VSEQLATPAAPAVPFEYAGRLVISVHVSDLERALEWYREMLGSEVVYKLDEYGWAEITSPVAGVTIGLGQTENPEVKGDTPTWTVADFDAARGYLESRGVRFDGETNNLGGMVLLATFFDPDGNSWMLAQRLETGYRNE
jgi:catechol 2,3-dioxygenase-like lactoylglutathione lyase family enzyme